MPSLPERIEAAEGPSRSFRESIILRLIRRAAVWVAFKFIPVEHPDAMAYVNERTNSDYIEDQVTIRRALECYYWIRRIIDQPLRAKEQPNEG